MHPRSGHPESIALLTTNDIPRAADKQTTNRKTKQRQHTARTEFRCAADPFRLNGILVKHIRFTRNPKNIFSSFFPFKSTSFILIIYSNPRSGLPEAVHQVNPSVR